MANVVVTGITGFIGSNLARKLVEKGYNVYGIDRPCASRSIKPIEDILSSITFLTADITSYASLLNVLRTSNPDYICHLAALSPVRYSFEHPFQYEQHNFVGTMNVAHTLMELPDYKTRRLIAASTAEVYGMQNRNEPFKEDSPLNPSSPYAVSKAAADMYLRMAKLAYNLNCVVLRPTNTYGRRYERGFIVEYLITSMLKNQKVYIGAPESIRDYIYVDDHVNAYLLAMEKEEALGQIYNVGSGKGISNKELAIQVATLTGYNSSNIVFGSYPQGYPMRPQISDQPYLVLNSSKIEREIGWRVATDLHQGLSKTIEFWKEQLKR